MQAGWLRLCYSTHMVRALYFVGMTLGVSLWADAAPARGGAKKAAVTVTGTTVGAKVLVDGKEVGKTPLQNKEVSAGAHTITVKKLGYLDFTEKIQAKPGKTVAIFADLLPFAGVIKVSANVAKALVTVDGKQVGKAPLEYEVKLGSHTVTVSAPGYATHSQTVSADPGNEYEIKANLAKRAGGDLKAGRDDLELALVPLAPSGGVSPRKGDGVGDLELAPLPGSAGGALGESGLDGDGPALEPLTATELTATTPTLGPSSPGFVGPTSGVTATIEAPKPWYKEWWVWTAGAAVVVTSVSLGIWAKRRDGSGHCYTVEKYWNTDPSTGEMSGPYEICE